MTGFEAILSRPYRLDELLRVSAQWDLYRGAGMGHYRVGNPAAAIPLLEEAVFLKPEEPYTHFILGRAYSGLGEHAQAAALFERALELNPDNPNSLFELGSSLVRLGQLDAGIAALSRSAELEPDPDTYVRLGAAYDLAGRPTLAREGYASALELDPEHPAAVYGLNGLGDQERGQD